MNTVDISVTLVFFFVLIMVGIVCLQYPEFANVFKGMRKSPYGIMMLLVTFVTVVGLGITSLGPVQPVVIGLLLIILVIMLINYWRKGYGASGNLNQRSGFRSNMLLMFVLFVVMIGCSALVVDNDRFFGESVEESEATLRYLSALRIAAAVGLGVFWILFIYVVWQSQFFGTEANLLRYPTMLSLLVLVTCYVFNKIAGQYAGWVMLAMFVVIVIACAVAIGLYTPFSNMFEWKNKDVSTVFCVVFSLVFGVIFNFCVTYAKKYPTVAKAEKTPQGEAVVVVTQDDAAPVSLQAFNIFMLVMVVVAIIVATVVAGKTPVQKSKDLEVIIPELKVT